MPNLTNGQLRALSFLACHPRGYKETMLEQGFTAGLLGLLKRHDLSLRRVHPALHPDSRLQGAGGACVHGGVPTGAVELLVGQVRHGGIRFGMVGCGGTSRACHQHLTCGRRDGKVGKLSLSHFKEHRGSRKLKGTCAPTPQPRGRGPLLRLSFAIACPSGFPTAAALPVRPGISADDPG
jgi:hypothetical protein